MQKGTYDCGRRPLGFQSRSSSSSVKFVMFVLLPAVLMLCIFAVRPRLMLV